MLTRAKSGSAVSNARISVGQTKVKSLDKNKNTSDMDCEQGRTFFETDSQRVEHQNHPNLDTSEATRPLREE